MTLSAARSLPFASLHKREGVSRRKGEFTVTCWSRRRFSPRMCIVLEGDSAGLAGNNRGQGSPASPCADFRPALLATIVHLSPTSSFAVHTSLQQAVVTTQLAGSIAIADRGVVHRCNRSWRRQKARGGKGTTRDSCRARSGGPEAYSLGNAAFCNGEANLTPHHARTCLIPRLHRSYHTTRLRTIRQYIPDELTWIDRR